MMGFNLGLNYKGWDFLANFYGTFGNDIFNLQKVRYSGGGGQNVYRRHSRQGMERRRLYQRHPASVIQ